GRLDSTNVITPLVTVVTKIAREHTDYLGTDLASIAREKAGIAKPNIPFVTGERDPDVRRVLVAEADRRGGSPVILVDTDRPPPPTSPPGLLGRHQHTNAWVALAALNALPAPFGPVGEEGLERPIRFAFEPDFERALELVQQGAETVIVTGSFHTVGDALARLPGFAPVA